MMFKEADLAAIKKSVDNFSAIAKKMGVSVTTDCTVSENQETLMITISVDGNAKSLRYTKSIALSWEDTVNKIKAGMLDALTQICAQDAPMEGVTVEKQKDIRNKAIDDFALWLENKKYLMKEMQERDFCYTHYDELKADYVITEYLTEQFSAAEATIETEPSTPVVFTILQCGHGVYRIITNHVVYRKMNTACITDLDILYETMQEIAQNVSEDCGRAVSFEVMEADNADSDRQLASDRELEKLWEELEDVLFVENDILSLVLESPWNGFDAGTDRESIWHWFDERHSKGVGWLLNEYKSAEEEGAK